MFGITTYNKIVFMLLTMFSVANCFAQHSSEAQKILAQAKLDIYEKPDAVIKVGDSLYKSPDSPAQTKVDALMIISDAYSSKRDYQNSLKYFQIASDLSKKANNAKLQVIVLSRMAVRYQQMKVYDKAIQCLDECDNIIAAKGDKNNIDNFTQATNYVVRGFIYKEQFNCDIAINYFNKGIEEYKKSASSVKPANLSIAYYNRGNCYVLLSKPEEAKSSFLEAIVFAEQVNANSLKAFALKGLAEVYRMQKDYTKAIEVLQEGVAISKNVGDLVLNRGLYLNLANNYMSVNNWSEYQKYNKLFLQNQSIIKESERESISDSIVESTALEATKSEAMRVRYYSIISAEILLMLFLLYALFVYQKRSIKSIMGLNSELKRIKETLKKH